MRQINKKCSVLKIEKVIVPVTLFYIFFANYIENSRTLKTFNRRNSSDLKKEYRIYEYI